MALDRARLMELGLGEAQAEAVLAEHEAAVSERERAFEAFRAEVEGRAKAAALRRMLREARIPEKLHDTIVRTQDLGGVQMDGDGFLDEEAVRRDVLGVWGDFAVTEAVRGVAVDTPPVMARPDDMTVEQIMAIEDDARREREIAEHHEMFGF